MKRAILFGAILGAAMVMPSAVMAKLTILPSPPPDDGIARPEPPAGWTYRWVPAVYRTVYDRYWVEGTYRMELRWVEIWPGQWEQRWVSVTQPGHWETTTRREVLTPGHWELVRIDPPPYYPPQPPRPTPYPIVSPGTVGVEGYARSSDEDMRKYSPLYEWPDKK